MFNTRFITGVMVAAGLAASNIVLGAGAASAYSGYLTQADCDSVVVGYSTETDDRPGYMKVEATATSGETKQLLSSFVAPGNSVEDATVQFSELPGTGPHAISLNFYDGDTITELDSVAVSDCDTPSAVELAEQALADAQKALAVAKLAFQEADTRAEKKAAFAALTKAAKAVSVARKALREAMRESR